MPAADAVAVACRPGCGACCIAPSISSLDKPAGMRCVHLDATERCTIFGAAERPQVCAALQPSLEMCGTGRAQALAWLTRLEIETAPAEPQQTPIARQLGRG